MNDEFVKQIADWVEFFRDLGFDDFYQGAELQSLLKNWTPDATLGAVPDAGTYSEAQEAKAEFPKGSAATTPVLQTIK
ncbi:MAG: hypothetical protein ACRD2O_13295, partial [Terriglobia bacterium]